MCNYSPTRFYLNYDHHSVLKLRKMYVPNCFCIYFVPLIIFTFFGRLKEPNFSQHQLTKTKKPTPVCTVNDIINVGQQFIEVECYNILIQILHNK